MYTQTFLTLMIVLASTMMTEACLGLGGGCCSSQQCGPQIPRCSTYSAPSSYGGSYASAPSYVSAGLGSSYAQPAPSYLNAPLPAPSPSEYPSKG